MDILKRTISALLVLVMVLGILPPPVLAGAVEEGLQETAPVQQETEPAATEPAETEPEYQTLEPITLERVNPLYGEAAEPGQWPDMPVMNLLQTEVCEDAAEMGLILREGIEDRKEVMTVEFKISRAGYSDDAFSAILDESMAIAMEHTGVPTQGDYLLWQYKKWKASASAYGDSTYWYFTITYMVDYGTTAEQEAQMDTAVDELLEALAPSGSNYNKIRTVYDYITANITYDHANLSDDTYFLKHTAYAALMHKTAVCQGYAVLLYRLALEMGIDCRVITGTSHGEGHAWNIVDLGGKYYNLDSTWDAGATDYTYFLKSQNNFPDHSRDVEYTTASFNAEYPMSPTDYTPGTEPEPHVHSYSAAVTAPTCTEQGYTTYTCACGDSYVADYTAAAGHSFGPWQTTKEPTEAEEGEQRRDCGNCDAFETQAIEKLPLGHTHSYTAVVKEPTCTEQGYTTYTCDCGDSYVDSYVPAKDHYFKKWVVTRGATNTQTGEAYRECAYCTEKETTTLEKLTEEGILAAVRTEGATIRPQPNAQGDTLGSYAYGAVVMLFEASGDYIRTGEGWVWKEDVDTSYVEMSHGEKQLREKLDNGEQEISVTHQFTLTEDLYIPDGVVILIENNGAITVPAGITLTVEGWLLVYDGALNVTSGGALEILNEAGAAMEIWGGKLDLTGADISGVPAGAIGIQICGDSQYKGISPQMLYAICIATEMSHVKEALAAAEDFLFVEIDPEAVFDLDESITIPENCILNLYYNYYEIYVPAGVTITNNGGIGVQNGNLMTLEEGARLINNGELYVDPYSQFAAYGDIENNGICESYITGTTMPQEDLEYFLDVNQEYGWVHVAETKLKKDLAVQTNLDLYRRGALIIPDGVTLVLEEDCYVSETSSILVEAGGALIVNGVLNNQGIVTVEAGAAMQVNGSWQGKDAYFPAAPHTHEYAQKVTDPTCTEQGYTTYSCACGDSYTDHYVPAKGHSFGSWFVTKEATASQEGEERRDCTNCDHYETRPIEKLQEEDAKIFTVSGDLSKSAPSQKEISDKFSAIVTPTTVFDETPSVVNPYKAGKLSNSLLQNGLTTLNYFRFVTRLPQVQLDEGLNDYAQHGAVVLAANDVLSHYPAQPGDMSDAFYEKGYAATTSSNISWNYGYPALSSVQVGLLGCLWDEDSSNISALGHRRWLLNPKLKNVGIGYAQSVDGGNYSVTKVFDTSGGTVDYDFVAFPASGNFPTNLFDGEIPWSVTLNPQRFEIPSRSDLTVTVTRHADGKTWTMDASADTPNTSGGAYLGVNKVGYGIPNCIIFSPGYDELKSCEGTFTVEINGLVTWDGHPAKLLYEINFFDVEDVEPDHTCSYTAVITKPTCTEQGYTTYVCNCGEYYVDNYVEPLGHNYTAKVTKEPGCETEGVKTYTCANDASHTYTESIPAVGHAYDGGVITTQPGCETEGVKTYTCANDASHTHTESIPAVGHAYDDGVITTQPGCETEGVKTYTCANDASHTHTESIPAVGHAYDDGVITTQPGCQTEGVKIYTCANDASHTYTETIPATGHTIGQWKYDETGHWHECETCGEKLDTAAHDGKICTHCGYESKDSEDGHKGKLGDVNHDGKINAKDATLILQKSVGVLKASATFCDGCAEVSGDGKLNAKDSTLILQFSVGLRSSFPAQK